MCNLCIIVARHHRTNWDVSRTDVSVDSTTSLAETVGFILLISAFPVSLADFIPKSNKTDLVRSTNIYVNVCSCQLTSVPVWADELSDIKPFVLLSPFSWTNQMLSARLAYSSLINKEGRGPGENNDCEYNLCNVTLEHHQSPAWC